MIRRPPRSTHCISSAASDVYKRQVIMVEKSGGDLKSIFSKYTSGKPEMDGKTFFKMFKDCGLVDKKLTQTVIDLTFTKFAEKGVKRMKYDQFLKGIAECATKKGVSEADLKAKITASGGPAYKGTKADAVKWHDDKALYTGCLLYTSPSPRD
eukprot:TRINITY_DN375_c0_g1_i6.p1 TRINITY_DN375_c0_g1~~TRINITY_DN375_c0_g1_i6.p1  ORF type:complete len:161 (-),score=66.58 TRINITY_DN375_c0_g1_i6:53-511(-)